MSDIEPVSELTSSLHVQVVLPGAIERAADDEHLVDDVDEGQDDEQAYPLM
jgi:hypothetical protein